MSSAENAPWNLERNLRTWASGAIQAEPAQVLAEVGAEITLRLLRARDTALLDYELDDLPGLYQGIRDEVTLAHQEFNRDRERLPDLVKTVVKHLKTEVESRLTPVEG